MKELKLLSEILDKAHTLEDKLGYDETELGKQFGEIVIQLQSLVSEYKSSIGACGKCQSRVTKSLLHDYEAYCPDCDEDLYEFEFNWDVVQMYRVKPSITPEDVLKIAANYKYSNMVTDATIQYVLDNFETTKLKNLNTPWDLVVEQLLFEALN
jgi:hypothetical protein